ncbi:MAG: hypothetical protein M3P96_04190 [Actinomycetota bacterium]|nr:hypothetical protein [Actinomycetota bacterium]
MSKHSRETVLCDICAKPQAESYRVRTPDGLYALDLCDEHAEPLERLVRSGVFTPAPPPQRKLVRMYHRVVRIDPALLPPED